jgi:hypothetical protein
MKYTLITTIALSLTLPAHAMGDEFSIDALRPNIQQQKDADSLKELRQFQDAQLAKIELYTEQQKAEILSAIEECEQDKKTASIRDTLGIDLLQTFMKYSLHLDEEIRKGMEDLKRPNELAELFQQSQQRDQQIADGLAREQDEIKRIEAQASSASRGDSFDVTETLQNPQPAAQSDQSNNEPLEWLASLFTWLGWNTASRN